MTYVDDLERIVSHGGTRTDLVHVDAAACFLATHHVALTAHQGPESHLRDTELSEPGAYEHEIRALLAGITSDAEAIASNPEATDWIETIVYQCRKWSFPDDDRATRIHGRFLPDHLTFVGDTLIVEPGRRAIGDPCEDLMAFMCAHLACATDRSIWSHGIRALWHRCWITYLHARPDAELFGVAPPWFARHAVATVRQRGLTGHAHLLEIAARSLELGWLDPMSADDVFAAMEPRAEAAPWSSRTANSARNDRASP
ncbi:MAG: hypothetical protein NT062_04360 [Proteobacteria bacterium]|nr:hypothetical protein [Pseudomonadota bacterium]